MGYKNFGLLYNKLCGCPESKIIDGRRKKCYFTQITFMEVCISMALTINKNASGDTLALALEGRLDTTTAPQLEAELKTGLEGIKTLTFDLEKLAYVSSAGLRVLLKAQKVMNKQGSMTIKNAGAEILEIFEVTGFDEILNIEK